MKSYRQVLISRVPEGQRKSARALVQSHGLPSPGSLRALIQKLEGSVVVVGDGGGGVATPQIKVTHEGSGAGSVFVIEGSGFLPNKTVTVRVVDDALATVTFPHSADESGKIAIRQSISCVSGLALHFSATDSRPNPSDLTGVLWSSTFTTICP
jgi:hypothetical protein